MYRPWEVKSRPLGYSQMQSFFFQPVWGEKKNLNSSISQRTTLAGCQKTWQNLETSDSVTLLDNWSPALPVKSEQTSSFAEVPIKLSSQCCTLTNTAFSYSLLCMPQCCLNHNVNCTGSVFFLCQISVSIKSWKHVRTVLSGDSLRGLNASF